ncbi:MAG: outer membrane protein assembly factor [Nitrospira sp.]|nr:outer membrane protein assembly factor [Nitrospira sp.]MDH5252151.1 outer membrane protein assembly factor [Nitrospira sp.]MDH5624752.1 outer membrane protein assembly factor [Nitrospira sp.]
MKTPVHSLVVSVSLVLLGSLCPSLPDRAQADTQYFPIPAVSSSKNDGNDVGLIVPALMTGPDGDLKYLVAPMVIYNSIVGTRGTLNLFHYQPGGKELRGIASWSEKIERRFLLSYVDPGLSNGRYSVAVSAAHFKNATVRFFGLGPGTVQDDETNYTASETRANWKFGVYANEVTQIAISQRFRHMQSIQQGATQLAFTGDMFPDVSGVDGATILGERISFHYDTRNNLVTPTDGTAMTAYAEINHNFRKGAESLYSRYGVEIKKMFASESKRAILVIRGDLQATIGTDVPFYELSSLGGQNNLRGFGVDRYIDKQLIALSIEERIHVLRARLAGVMADFEITPFIDTGQVFNSFKNVGFRDYRITPGIGFRGIVRPNVVGRIDYGFSREGGAIFAGLDFPY